VTIDPDEIRQNILNRKYPRNGNRAPLPESISQEAFRGPDGRTLQDALAISEGSLRSVRPPEGTGAKEQQTFHAEVNDAEKRDYLKWAQETGRFIPEDEFNRHWEEGGKRGESEHDVYYDAASMRWFKRNALNFDDGSISSYLERLAIQRALFPDLAPRLEGFTEYRGEVQPVISQPDAVGEGATEAEIGDHLRGLGFQEVFEPGEGMSKAHSLAEEAGLNPPPLEPPRRIGWLNKDGVWVEDVHEENAVNSPNGNVNVFDPVAYIVERRKLNLKRAEPNVAPETE